MAAWHEPSAARVSVVAFLLYLLAWAGLLGMILWKLWTTLHPIGRLHGIVNGL